MIVDLTKSAQKVQNILKEKGIDLTVIQFPESTRTAQNAAAVIGCTVGQIAKSLIFKAKLSGDPVLIIASGSNRVDEGKVARYLGEAIQKADADFVLKHTGYTIGGVSPIGIASTIKTLIDVDLFNHTEIWAAAGTSHSVFKLSPKQLQNLTGGEIVDIKVL